MRAIDRIRRDHRLHQEFIRAFIKKAKETNKLELIEHYPQPQRGWKGTPLWYAAARASDYDCMKILLEEGSASPHATVEVNVLVNGNGVDDRQELQWVKMTILRSILPPFYHSRNSSLEDRATLLIEHGVRLDAKVDQVNPSSSTVFDMACAYCEGKRKRWLLDIILRTATNNNVSVEHVAELEKKYRDDPFILRNLEMLRERLNKQETGIIVVNPL